MNPTRAFAAPAVQIGAQRTAAVLRQQRVAQRFSNTLATLAAFAAAYAFANAPPSLVLLIVASGIALGASVSRTRAFGERHRMIQTVVPIIAKDEARILRLASRRESRWVLGVLILTAALLITTIAWAAVGPARETVAIACILGLAYLRSSIKALMPGGPQFAELAEAARAQGCRIALFRSFAEGPARLTRNVLLPILAGYGDLHIVFDRTLVGVEEESFLGETIPQLERIATVHSFDNEEWQARVAELIALTDIAVIEATRLTPGVTWELARCLKELPPWRVYPVIHLEGLDGTPLSEYAKTFYELVGREPDMPQDVATRWFYLGEGASQQETVAEDVHAKMLSIIAIESGLEDASAFGPGAAAWLSPHMR